MMNQNKRLVYEVKDLKKVLGNRTILQISRLEIHPGTIYGIVGSVGSGKTTLLKILCGKEKETSGVLKYDDESFPKDWFGKIKSNDDILLASVLELQEKLSAHQLMKSLYPNKHESIYQKHFANKSLKPLWDQTISKYSPGEKICLNNIIAVSGDPRVLLVDDYGTKLDNKMEFEFHKNLVKMNKQLGTTIIAASSDDFHLKKFAAVLIYLDNGHISKIRPGKIRNKDKYSLRR